MKFLMMSILKKFQTNSWLEVFFVKITPLTQKKKLKHTSNDPNTSKKS
jgi:hypothetical protein